LNHPRAFANAADSDFLSANRKLHRDLFRLRIAGHNRFSRCITVLHRVAKFDRCLNNAGADMMHWHGDTDAARRTDQRRTSGQL